MFIAAPTRPSTKLSYGPATSAADSPTADHPAPGSSLSAGSPTGTAPTDEVDTALTRQNRNCCSLI
jgi:hypothetical protein